MKIKGKVKISSTGIINMVNIIFLKYVIIWIVRHNIFDIAFQYITELVNGIDFNILIVS